MARDGTSMVKFVNPHPLRIDVVKFDGRNNFGIWRSEMKDAMTASNLKDTLQLEKKHESTTEKEWDKMYQTTCGFLLDTRHQVSCVA